MPSPFPGMDPYLENPAIWSDFHGTFLMAMRAELNRLLPEGYTARWDRYVWLDGPDTERPRRLGEPDTFVSDLLNRDAGSAAAAVLEAPATTTLPAVDAKGKPFLKIVDALGARVVTVVEMLSPGNKSGENRELYLVKRQEYFRSGTNLVEIDFLRNGLRPPVQRPLPPASYYIMISRAIDYPQAGVWPLTLRDPLPRIPVPLDAQVEPVFLALRPCLDRAYEEGCYERDIDYDQAPIPPLAAPDATWARELLTNQH